jgi:hypothetical protein
MIVNRIKNVRVQTVGGTIHTGNAHEWEIRP